MKIKDVYYHMSENIYGREFWCPGCEEAHVIDLRWNFNDDYKKPTADPSLRVLDIDNNGMEIGTKCHLLVENGKLTYLMDSQHKLAGHTVEMVDVDG